MTEFLIASHPSFTLIVSPETGKMGLGLREDIARSLAALQAEGASEEEVTAALLDRMGAEDAAAYLQALGALAGVGAEFADAFAAGGMDGLTAAVEEAAAGRSDGWFDDAVRDTLSGTDTTEGFGAGLPGGGFEAVGATDLADMLRAGQPGDIATALDKAAEGAEGRAMEDDGLEPSTIGLIGGLIAGAILGYGADGAEGAVLGATAGAFGGFILGEVYEHKQETSKKPVDLLEGVTFLPESPDQDGLDEGAFLDFAGEFLDPWTPDPTTTMPSDPDAPFRADDGPTEEDMDVLDHVTQPVGPDDAERPEPQLEGDDPMGLDPLINPGHEPVDGFDFGDLDAPFGGDGSGPDIFVDMGGVTEIPGEVLVPMEEAEPVAEAHADPATDHFEFL